MIISPKAGFQRPSLEDGHWKCWQDSSGGLIGGMFREGVHDIFSTVEYDGRTLIRKLRPGKSGRESLAESMDRYSND